MNRKLPAVLAAVCLLLTAGCGKTEVRPAVSAPPAASAVSPAASSAAQPDQSAEAPPAASLPAPVSDPVAHIMENMTAEEKVGQLFFVRCPAEDDVADVAAYHLGGYILFGRDTKDKTANDLI